MSDMFKELFAMQSKLNNFVFAKKGIKNVDGKILTSEELLENGKSELPIGPNTNTNHWLLNFLTAMDDESRELREELLWKWWSKDSLNIQNIRVEIIDQLHFWISLAIVSGMDAEKVFDIYKQKNEVNIKRQETDYSKENKNESDNKNIH